MTVEDIGDIHSTQKGTGCRKSKGKISFSLVPFNLLAGVGRIFMYGAVKYAPFNWAKGMPWSVPFDCCLRHLFKWFYLREDLDPESLEHHIDHAIANLLMIKHYLIAYKEGDDRPPDYTMFNLSSTDFCKPFDNNAA